jgi:hypothetical protein
MTKKLPAGEPLSQKIKALMYGISQNLNTVKNSSFIGQLSTNRVRRIGCSRIMK